jgi:putative ABC transport system ATP-binding protein
MLRIRNLHKVREQGGVRFELRVPEFSLQAGQFAAVVGPSGCGKSTLLDMLALVLKPSRCDEFWLAGRKGTEGVAIGQLWTAGNERALAAIRRRDLGYVLQTGGLMPFLSVEENIRLPVRILGGRISKDEIRNLARGIDIEGVLAKKPHHLSGGQRQRAAILRALVHQPRLILADEPTAAVDKPRARAIVQDFKTLANKRSATVAMVTHDYELVQNHADVVYAFEVTALSATSTCSVCQRQREKLL